MGPSFLSMLVFAVDVDAVSGGSILQWCNFILPVDVIITIMRKSSPAYELSICSVVITLRYSLNDELLIILISS